MKREEHVDYFTVLPQHGAIHARLEAWARWVRVRPYGWQVQPMFRQYRSKAWQWHRPEPKETINLADAMETEKAVSLLPAKNRDAIRWAYVGCGRPIAAARRLSVTKDGLMRLVHDGRTRLKTMGIA